MYALQLGRLNSLIRHRTAGSPRLGTRPRSGRQPRPCSMTCCAATNMVRRILMGGKVIEMVPGDDPASIPVPADGGMPDSVGCHGTDASSRHRTDGPVNSESSGHCDAVRYGPGQTHWRSVCPTLDSTDGCRSQCHWRDMLPGRAGTGRRTPQARADEFCGYGTCHCGTRSLAICPFGEERIREFAQARGPNSAPSWKPSSAAVMSRTRCCSPPASGQPRT